MPIYTKTGDKGDTGLFDGKRVSKASLRIEAIGTVDELNSTIGFAISQFTINNSSPQMRDPGWKLPAGQLTKELKKIQNDLFVIGGGLANPPPSPKASAGQARQKIGLEIRTKEIEKFIDEMTKELPPLFNFILPGGGLVGSYLHIARTVCRRAERRIVSLSEKEKVQSEIIIYINRLSDLFLTMSRFVNMKEKKKETIWKGER